MKKEPTSTAERVLGALAESPGGTAAELADALGAGRSTVAKALVALATDGRVIRRAGEAAPGGRSADRWSLATAKKPAAKKAATPAKAGDRLAKGELRAAVLAHLRAHRGEDLSPTAVARALGRSAGATANALARLADAGEALEVPGPPRRFRIAR